MRHQNRQVVVELLLRLLWSRRHPRQVITPFDVVQRMTSYVSHSTINLHMIYQFPSLSEHQLDLYEIFVRWETYGIRSFRSTEGDVLTSVETLGASWFILLCQDPKDANLVSVLQLAAPECNLSPATQSRAFATCARPKCHGAFARRLIRKKITDLNHSYENNGCHDDDIDGNNDGDDDDDAADLQYYVNS